MPKCSKCGAEISEDAIFCTNCGEPRRLKLLSIRRIYLIPVIFSMILILVSLYSLIAVPSYVIHAQKHWLRSTSLAAGGYTFYVRQGQILMVSFRVDNDSDTPYVWIAEEENAFEDYAKRIWASYTRRSGSGRVVVPSTGRYTLVWRTSRGYAGGYLSIYIELRASHFSYIDIAVLLLGNTAFLIIYSIYFPKIEAKILREKKMLEDEMAELKGVNISEEEARNLYMQLLDRYSLFGGRKILDREIETYIRRGLNRNEAIYFLAKRKGLLYRGEP